MSKAKAGGPITYDVHKLTARQVLDFSEASRADNTDKLAVVLAACCTACPANWGNPQTAATFAELSWGDWKAAMTPFRTATREAMAAAEGAVPSGVSYDLDRLPAREVAAFIRGLKREDIRSTAGMLARIVTSVPAEWGPFSQPSTFLALPYYDTFMPLALGVLNDANDAEKNERNDLPSSSPA